MDDVEDILVQSRLYLKQQGEMYGSELILDNADILTNPPKGFDGSLRVYCESIQECGKCALAKSRQHFVFGVGDPNANLMLVGEAPGRDEDIQGEPFVGQAGQLLDKILAAIDFKREEVFIGNVLKCRPPQNRDPLPEEIALCMPYLKEQIRRIQPKVILALGRIAAQSMLGTMESLTRLREEFHSFEGIPLMVTYHPAALLRNPQWKRPVWEDVQRLRLYYDQTVGDKPAWQPPKK